MYTATCIQRCYGCQMAGDRAGADPQAARGPREDRPPRRAQAGGAAARGPADGRASPYSRPGGGARPSAGRARTPWPTACGRATGWRSCALVRPSPPVPEPDRRDHRRCCLTTGHSISESPTTSATRPREHTPNSGTTAWNPQWSESDDCLVRHQVTEVHRRSRSPGHGR